MLEQHDYIILFIVGAIILLQLYVFAGNLRKINTYKKTIDSASNFGIVEVEIPEERIKEIEVSEILSSPEAFQNSLLSPLTTSASEDPIQVKEEFSAYEEEIEPAPIETEKPDFSTVETEEPVMDHAADQPDQSDEEFYSEEALEIEEFEEEDFEFEEDKIRSKLNSRR